MYLSRLILKSLFCLLLSCNAIAFDLVKSDEQLRNLIVKTSREFVGVRYVFGGNRISSGLDCSSFVQKIFSFYGISLPRNTQLQYAYGEPIADLDNLRPGDLLFFSKNGKVPSHVGIVSDRPNYFIHARRGKGTSRGVEETRYDSTYYRKHFIGAVRVLVD